MSGRTLRILYVITDLEIGGVPLHLLRLACAVQQRGHTVQVVSLSSPGPVGALLRDRGVRVSACNAERLGRLRALWRLRREIRFFRPDVIHSLLFHANLACRLIGPVAGVPPRRLICEIQTVEIERPWHLRLDRWTHPLCRLELGNSAAVVEHLAEKGGLPARKLRVVESGIDVEQFAGARALSREQMNLPDGPSLLLWVGRLDPVKGLPDLLRALDSIGRRHDVHLALLGDGTEKDALQQLTRDLQLQQRVTFAGIRHDVPGWLKACDVFVFPSRTEGRPNALLEAMAAGCAIVCSDIPGNRALITPSVSGLCVPPADPERLATAVLTLLKDPALARHLGDAAAERAVRHACNDSRISGYIDLYYS